MLPVEYELAPAVRVSDVVIVSDWQSGEMRVTVTVRNDIGQNLAGQLSLSVVPDKTGKVLTGTTVAADFTSGVTGHIVRLTVRQHRLWELSDPFLYRIRIVLTVESAGCAHERSVRCGFRDFRVKKGFLLLNGRRMYLRCCHTTAWYPVTICAPNADLMHRDLIYAKDCGFNCVRFISRMALPEQLDLCDEIGLMIYEEPYASWWLIRDLEGVGYAGAEMQWVKPAVMIDPDIIRTRYENAFHEIILRDRNHPCITIWGMLKLVRSLEATRLVSRIPIAGDADTDQFTNAYL